MTRRSLVWVLTPWFLIAGCESGTEDLPLLPEEELGIGEIDDLKLDGDWGSALTCKPIPTLDRLPSPEVVVSLDGLTLHLFDRTTGFDKVYPIGPGKIDKGVSLTPVSTSKAGGRFYMRLDQPEYEEPKTAGSYWSWNYRCRHWWLDQDTGRYSPVFAGMPFIRLDGPNGTGYGIHGPIDSYTIPSGGKLQRGYVSHGCVRMEAADIVEVYARCRGKKVPVRVQKSVERRADGTAVDLAQRWVLSECKEDADCNFPGGICKRNDFSLHGYCVAPCTQYCSLDKWGYPTSFCVADPDDSTKGICTLKSISQNNVCKRYPGFLTQPGERRFNQPSVKADVCLPGSQGWIGHPCFSDIDCLANNLVCDLDGADEDHAGVCTRACTSTCPDQAGMNGTFCVAGSSGGQCVSRCFNQDDCLAGTTCTPGTPRYNQTSVTANACL